MKVKCIQKLENKKIQFIKLMGNFECLYDLLLFDTIPYLLKDKIFCVIEKINAKGNCSVNGGYLV
jgi:uncharacterized protein with ATP-grasp and redox domains